MFDDGVRESKRASISYGLKGVRFERRGRVAQYFGVYEQNIDAKVTDSPKPHPKKLLVFVRDFVHNWG